MAWLRAVFFLDESRGWAAGGGGALLATTDGGASWHRLARPTEDTLRDVYFHDTENGWLVCERSLYALSTADELRSYLLRTSDGGRTWTRVNATGQETNARLTRMVFADRMNGWTFGEEGAVYATRDGGATWRRQSVPRTYLLLGGDAFDAAHAWLVGAGGTALYSTDGGETWRAGAVDMPRTRLNAVSFVDTRRGWAVGAEGRIFMTADGGRTWRAQASRTRADLHDVRFLNARDGWAAGAEGTVLRTTDGGLRWRVEQSDTGHPLERLALITPTRGWAVGFGGTILTYAAATSRQPALSNPR